jgi:hypothetical protein
MATPQNGKPEPSRIIGSISNIAGVLVGTAVVTGKRIIGLVKPPSEGPSDKPGEKTVKAPAKRKKKKKKEVKRKGTGSSGERGASKKTPTQSPAKKKKGATPKKKTTRREKKKTANSEGSSHSQDGLISEIDKGANVPIGKQEP